MSETIQVAIVRTVKSGREAEFEDALHDFVQQSLSLPGQLGVSVLRPVPGSGSRQYGIIRKFSGRDALNEFRISPEYLEWNQRVLNLTEGEGDVEELSGLESWFTLPGHALEPLPPWKMAVVTYIGVDIVTTLLFYPIGPVIQNWPFLIRNSAFNIAIVACLTWIAMPLLTRVFNRWLQPKL
ncbi:MAG TPA: antibiotic biosynthesis monooxygenase [Candidatus Acidoferrales bacterium]|jgi:antibiotic biosynthesis monooxygenase (ABM) superfamily enzyme|nr:antibiotic biosynthesis monooxygenase [Candidatus Acidoferrales bacterium]